MELTSPSFPHGEAIPRRHTCDGQNVSPPLVIEEIPAGTKSLCLIVEDPDASGKTWVHWVLFNIPVTGRIEENSHPGRQGRNDFRKQGYGGPCPPSGTHRYFFRLFALDRELGLPDGATRQQVEKLIEGHILDRAELSGTYSR